MCQAWGTTAQWYWHQMSSALGSPENTTASEGCCHLFDVSEQAYGELDWNQDPGMEVGNVPSAPLGSPSTIKLTQYLDMRSDTSLWLWGVLANGDSGYPIRRMLLNMNATSVK